MTIHLELIAPQQVAVISVIISNLDHFHYLLTRYRPPQHAHHPATELTNNELTDNGAQPPNSLAR
jgi:hypothetical protein